MLGEGEKRRDGTFLLVVRMRDTILSTTLLQPSLRAPDTLFFSPSTPSILLRILVTAPEQPEQVIPTLNFVITIPSSSGGEGFALDSEDPIF